MNKYIYDEICAIKNIITPNRRRVEKGKVSEEYIILVNSSRISQMYASAMVKIAKGFSKGFFLDVIKEEGDTPIWDEYLEAEKILSTNYPSIKFYDGVNDFVSKFEKKVEKNLFVLTFYDGNSEGEDENHCYLEKFDAFMCKLSKQASYTMVHCTELPKMNCLPEGMLTLAEREYDAYAAACSEKSGEKTVIGIEDIIRKYYSAKKTNIVVLRVNGLFGPGTRNLSIQTVLDGLKDNNQVEIDAGATKTIVGLTYIRSAMSMIFRMLRLGKSANIYNVQQYQVSEYMLSCSMYEYMAEYGVHADYVDVKGNRIESYAVCTKKLYSLFEELDKECFTEELGMGQELHRTACAILGKEYSNFDFDMSYDGKLEQIKKIEIDVIKEIKRICEKHNIKFFLVGGSILGAVRHKGFIPWDDDLDIGMLRDDYEKFRKVAPLELSDKYVYQSPKTEKNSHYIFDKIRLKDTFFSTKFSDQFAIENGLFIDILVYDKTAKSKKMQKLHINMLRAWNRAINVRWVNHPRENIAYRLSKVLLPVMRLFPWGFYHAVYNGLLKLFRHSKSQWAIDGVGQNLYKGAFPIAWFEETIDVPFDDTTFPIPKEYDAYCRHWYGNNYMSLLPYSERYSGHTMRRIDLGNEITQFGLEKPEVRHASKIGELLDYYDEVH